MERVPTPLIDMLTEIKHCSCLHRFLWTTCDADTYEAILDNLRIIVTNHRALHGNGTLH